VLTASNDADGDGLPDAAEDSNHDGLIAGDTNNNRIRDAGEVWTESNPTNPDSDGDGMPDGWEVANSFDPRNPSDAILDADRDGLTNLEEYQLGLNPLIPDFDGDGMADGWELANGFDPKNPGDAALDPDGDGLTNVQEYQRGTNPHSANNLTRYYYDRNDRLLGVEYPKGVSIGYQYDGNGNLGRQVALSRALENGTNGLPVLWRFLNGLSPTDNSGTNAMYADADGDGWSNYQEWKAGSNPLDGGSVPVTNIVQTAPQIQVLTPPSQGSTWALVRVLLQDAEGNSALPFLQYSNAATLGWSNAAVMRIDNTNCALLSRGVAAPPIGANHDLVWNSGADLGSVNTNVLLRARAQDQASTNLFGAWSEPVAYQITASLDSDGDGLPDWWEIKYFGSVAQAPGGDFDGDGVSNYAEYVADTNPADPTSYLRITSAQAETNGVRITWSGGVQARQYLQWISSLNGTENWVNLQTNQPPTAISDSYMDAAATNGASFYRIRVERP
jgi:YD repeat-containing protein